MKNLLQELQEKSAGMDYMTRKEVQQSMEVLAEQGYTDMELRTSEISPKDIEYLQNQGFIINRKVERRIPYYIISWRNPNQNTSVVKELLQITALIPIRMFTFSLRSVFGRKKSKRRKGR